MKFTQKDIKAVFTVGIIMALRLMGIFLIIPVFSVYTERYPGADLTLAGIAFGIYALFEEWSSPEATEALRGAIPCPPNGKTRASFFFFFSRYLAPI